MQRIRILWGIGIAAAALLCLWVLAADVYGDFRGVRIKLLTQPLPPRQSVSVFLPIGDIPDPYLVFVYRVRNIGTVPVTVLPRAGGQLFRPSSIKPGSSARVDLEWPHPATAGASYAIDLTGTTDRWTVEYAELANLHGFTRGAVEFLILPAAQPFDAAPPWTFGVFIASLLLVMSSRPPLWRPWSKTAHRALSIMIGAFFAVVAITPAVSPFRIVLAPHTFVGSLVIVALPQWATLVGRIRRRISLTLTANRRLASVMAHAIQDIPWTRVALVTSVVGYAMFLWMHVGAYAGGADSSGYMNSARILSEGHVSTPVRELHSVPPGTVRPIVYMPLGFRTTGSNALVPTYPIGLPLTLAVLARLTGWELASDFAMILYALAGLVLLFWLARECGLSQYAAAIGTILLATSPLYLLMSLTLMSDIPALVWTTAAVLLAWRSRRKAEWALVGGIAASLAVLTRPTNILIFVPVAVALGISPRRWLLFMAGGLPGAALLVAYNRAAYGTAVTTGYGDLSQFFGLANVLPSLGNYVLWLPVLLTPIGVLALGLPSLLPKAPRLATVLMLWILAFLVFYAHYSFTHETWWYTRFLLPAFPPLIVGSLWVGSVMIERWFSRRFSARVWLAVLPALILAHNGWWGRYLGVLESGSGERTYLEAAEWARSNLPPNAAVAAMQMSGAFFYYTDFPTLRWDYLDRETLQRVQSEAIAGRQPLYAALFPFDIELNAFGRLSGRWVQIARVKAATIWRFEGIADYAHTAGETPRQEWTIER